MQTRPERCIFHSPPSQTVSEIHPLSVPREGISIHLSPIQAVLSPTNFHQVTQTSNRDSKENGYPDKVYLDDMLIMNSTLEGAREDILILKSILENLGFLINMAKSIFIPVQVFKS